MKGRKPKPIEQRQREGNPGKRAMPQPVVVAGRALQSFDLPEAPDHLDDEARQLYHDYGQHLSAIGILDLADLPALVGMCEAEMEARRAYEALRLEGHTIRGDRSEAVIHPAFKVWRDSRAMFLRYAEHFGFTPVARARIGLAGLMGRKLADQLDLPAHPRERAKAS